MYVNSTSLEGASLDAAVQALKGAPLGLVSIGVCKPSNVEAGPSLSCRQNFQVFKALFPLFKDFFNFKVSFRMLDVRQAALVRVVIYRQTHRWVSNHWREKYHFFQARRVSEKFTLVMVDVSIDTCIFFLSDHWFGRSNCSNARCWENPSSVSFMIRHRNFCPVRSDWLIKEDEVLWVIRNKEERIGSDF